MVERRESGLSHTKLQLLSDSSSICFSTEDWKSTCFRYFGEFCLFRVLYNETYMLSNFKLSMFNMKTIRCLIFVAVTNLFDNLKKVDRIRSFPAFPSDFWCFVPGGIPWERFCLTWHRKVTRLLKLAVYSFVNFLSPFFLDFLGCALSWHQGLQITCLLYTFNQSSPFLR